MGKKKALYTGIFLEEGSKAALLSAMSSEVDLHENLVTHHLTLKFKPTPEEVKDLPIGSRVSFLAVGHASDDQAQAVACALPDGLTCANEHPHVTVALAEGAKAVYSNTLLAGGFQSFHSPVVLIGRVGFATGSGEIRYTLERSIYE